MQPKKVFAVCFFLCALLFLLSAVFLAKEYLHVIAMHMGIFFLAMFFIWKDTAEQTMRSIGIPGNIKKNIIYTAIGFFAIMVSFILLNVIALNFQQINDSEKVAQRIITLPGYLIFFAVVIVPITEEMFFRGFLTTRFGIIISSILFGVSHIAYGSVMEILGAFIVGLIFAYIYKKSGSIIPSITLHFFYNLISVLIIGNGI